MLYLKICAGTFGKWMVDTEVDVRPRWVNPDGTKTQRILSGKTLL